MIITSSPPSSSTWASALTSAASSDGAATVPAGACQSSFLDTTTFIRPGNGRPIESQVLRPMMMGLPMVACLKYFKSPGRYQGSWLFLPMTRFLAIATISAFLTFLYLSYLCLAARYRLLRSGGGLGAACPKTPPTAHPRGAAAPPPPAPPTFFQPLPIPPPPT